MRRCWRETKTELPPYNKEMWGLLWEGRICKIKLRVTPTRNIVWLVLEKGKRDFTLPVDSIPYWSNILNPTDVSLKEPPLHYSRYFGVHNDCKITGSTWAHMCEEALEKYGELQS